MHVCSFKYTTVMNIVHLKISTTVVGYAPPPLSQIPNPPMLPADYTSLIDLPDQGHKLIQVWEESSQPKLQ